MLCSAAAPSPRDKRLLKAAPNEGSAKCSLHAGEPQQYIYSSVTDRIIMKPLVMREPDTWRTCREPLALETVLLAVETLAVLFVGNSECNELLSAG